MPLRHFPKRELAIAVSELRRAYEILELLKPEPSKISNDPWMTKRAERWSEWLLQNMDALPPELVVGPEGLRDRAVILTALTSPCDLHRIGRKRDSFLRAQMDCVFMPACFLAKEMNLKTPSRGRLQAILDHALRRSDLFLWSLAWHAALDIRTGQATWMCRGMLDLKGTELRPSLYIDDVWRARRRLLEVLSEH